MSGWPLVAHSLRRARVLIAIVALILAGFQWLMTLAAKALQSMGAFGSILAMLPPAIRVLAGPSLVPLMSFAGMVSVGYFHLIVLAALVALAVGVGTETAGEIEQHLVDVLLSRPFSRAWLVTRTITVLAASILSVLLAMALGTWTGLLLFAPEGVQWPKAGLIASLVINLGAMMLAWGSVALAVSVASRRRVVAGSITAVAALVTFLIDYLARLWEPMQRVSWLSPFHYMNQLELLTGAALPWRDVSVLIAIAITSTGIAFAVILRRDL